MAARKRRHDAYGLAVTLLAVSGCMIGRLRTSPGPHGGRWIEAEYAALRAESADTPRWWEVFSDPVLGRLVDCNQRPATRKTRHTTPPALSATNSVPSRNSVIPTGRRYILPVRGSAMKPVRKSSG
ncbi:MAG: hypothetical protein ACREXW_14095 [Gammaproteobacteria bacterium]